MLALTPDWLLQLKYDQGEETPLPPAPEPATPGVLKWTHKYLTKCNPAIGTGGLGGHDQTFKVAYKLVRGLNLPAESAFDLLWTEYNPRLPP